MAESSDKKNSHSTRWILASLATGLALGIFMGELAAPLSLAGDAYVGLLQMTVLPYILFSLIGNVGRMSMHDAVILTRAGIATLLALWGVAIFTVLLMAAALPHIPTGSFFSTSLLEQPPRVDFLGLFIPSNLFTALSSNAVPAVVVFCLLFGTALIGFEGKSVLLDQFNLVTAVLQKVNSMVVRLAPVGIFCIAASAAGTLSLEEFGRLQAYLVTMSLAVLLLVFLFYPLLITACTELSWRDVLVDSRDALITTLVLGSIFAVIPLLIRTAEALVEKMEPGEEAHHLPQLLLPLAYPFPDAGKILTLLFVPFAAWFYGNSLAPEDMALLVTVGPVVMFGKVVTAVPYLMNLFEIPSDIFQLFLASGVLMGRLADVAGAMYLVTFTVLTTAVVRGHLKVRWGFMLPRAGLLIVTAALLVVALNTLFYESYKGAYDKSRVLREMQSMSSSVDVRVLERAQPNPVPLSEGQAHGQRINERGILRVGFVPDRLPFSYFNGAGQLVGFDIDLVQRLARDLGLGVEFVPYNIANLARAMEEDHFDIAVSGITATARRSQDVLFTEPYLLVNMALVVSDFRKRDFASEKDIRGMSNLRLAARQGSNFIPRAQAYFPGASLIPIASEREFFNDEDGRFDGLLTSAEGGAAWTLIYPDFSTINPVSRSEQAPLVIAIPPEMDIEEYLEIWITLRRLDGTMDRLFDYWILGRDPEASRPRWSIMRDVLHWQD